jgi:putative hydrolase of the HAD superfamily
MEWGHEMLRSPVELLPGVRDAVDTLAARVPLILLTKGDLFHQESKLARSGLADYFSGVEIVSEKDASVYRAVMARHRVVPERFLMAGNSLRSDVLPVLEAGGKAVYIPYPIVWSHEHVAPEALGSARFHEIENIGVLPALVEELNR